jgi:hypothetical protein
MKKYSEFQKVVSVILSFIMLISVSGCYSLHSLTRNEIQYANRTTYFLHGPDSYYKLANATISNGVLSATIDYVVSHPEKAKTIHIYVAPDSVIKKTGDKVQIPFANIAKVEVFELDGMKTIMSVAGTICTALIVVFLIALIAKGSSCPFIYASTGNVYNFTGEIYSGATALPLERNDYLPIGGLKPIDNKYNLRITNEVNEIQKTNLTELVLIDHNPESKILMDKYGTAYSLATIKRPSEATDTYGNSILKELSNSDSLRYVSSVIKDQIIKDTISLTFDKPENVTSSKLVIKGKNTMWLDYIYGKFSDLFGNRFEKWKEKSDRKPREELLKWEFDQGMPLAVYLQTESGLKLVDYFNLPGPMADKEDILQIDLSEIHTDKVKLKLVSGVLFWDIDYVGMDFTSSEQVNTTVVPIYSAIDENGKDVTPLLAKDDDKYLIQPLPVNKTNLTFMSPECRPGMERTAFLHSKGHYEILRDTKGKPDIAYLKTFLEPGAFIKYSKDHFLEYYFTSN